MDTTTLLYIGLAVIVVGVLVYQVVTSNSRRNKRFLSSIINSWGNLPKREYDYGELEHIAKYFQATKKDTKNPFQVFDVFLYFSDLLSQMIASDSHQN